MDDFGALGLPSAVDWDALGLVVLGWNMSVDRDTSGLPSAVDWGTSVDWDTSGLFSIIDWDSPKGGLPASAVDWDVLKSGEVVWDSLEPDISPATSCPS